MTLFFLGVLSVIRIGDGIFDKLSNESVSQVVWEVFKETGESIHHLAGKANEKIIRTALAHKASDNVTGILIVFENVYRFLQENTKDNEELLKSSSNLCVNKKSAAGVVVRKRNRKISISLSHNIKIIISPFSEQLI